MPVLALLLLGVFAEVAVMVAVGNAIGGLWMIALLLVGTLVGLSLVRRQGAHAVAALRESVLRRQQPHQEMADGMLIAAAGALIMVPGFLSDVVALFLLFPPTRRIVSRRVARRAEAAALKFEHERRFGAGQVVEGEVVDAEPVIIADRRELT
ncbi:FxsA family protein [Lentzea sp.]|uniref:FxsA family protein n=1 Tax=Lentzea sp. TaxID=56099 RepID=UPI002CB4ECB0|nr:FxsA family protein [Lentzea sp.]HUQ54241.1 FxsA family protein [Lentzea sp.]